MTDTQHGTDHTCSTDFLLLLIYYIKKTASTYMCILFVSVYIYYLLFVSYLSTGYVICLMFAPVTCDCQQLSQCFHNFDGSLQNVLNMTIDQESVVESINQITMFLCQ